IPHPATPVQPPALEPLVAELAAYVRRAATAGTPAHEAESDIWTRILAVGHQALGLFFHLQGPGDIGETVALSDGTTAQRLPCTHRRTYRSVFGDFALDRTAYGTREGQAIAFVPLDARLQLPASDYSYLLQKWDQALGCEAAFARVGATLSDVLGLTQSTDSLERMNRHMADAVRPFREARPVPDPADEGEVMVARADGKGVVMRRPADEPPILGHRTKGQKASRKRMAIVGAVYSVGRAVRTPADVVASLFRDPAADRPVGTARPAPVGKHLWASLTHERDGGEVAGTDEVFPWLARELARRSPTGQRETVYLMDGQESLWAARRAYLPGEQAVEVLDLLHVTPRLWAAAHVFHREGTAAAVAFVRDRLTRVLNGQVAAVVGGLRQMGTKRGLTGPKRKRLDAACGYLAKNAPRMRYHEYLAKGYPIASGVIEGACRHYVKDRMERAGMHWTSVGAQAMLDVRSEFLNGDWEAFQTFRIDRETKRLHPDRQLLDRITWTLAV
ncbi:MAG TPA: ISKra4 family transposase, partial [Urbifossiella sp.]|nr:ISKra4 family transposase [Urbifossiella sp.]